MPGTCRCWDRASSGRASRSRCDTESDPASEFRTCVVDVPDAPEDRAAVRPLARRAPRSDQRERSDARVGHVRGAAERGASVARAIAADSSPSPHPPPGSWCSTSQVEALLHVPAQRLGLDGRRPAPSGHGRPARTTRDVRGLLRPRGLIRDLGESDPGDPPGGQTGQGHDHRQELPSMSHGNASSRRAARLRPTCRLDALTDLIVRRKFRQSAPPSPEPACRPDSTSP